MKSDLSNFCAVKHLSHTYREWGIVDKEHFKNNGTMKDCHLNLDIPGMEEVSDSTYVTLDKTQDGRDLLEKAGIDIEEKPLWWFSKSFKRKRIRNKR